MHLLYFILVVQLLPTVGTHGSEIVGGKEAKHHSRPYMVSLQNAGRHVCGGVLIRRDFVLTSGHCLQRQPLEVVLGAHNLTQKESTQQKIRVARYHRHPLHLKYNQPRYDIMLLKLQDKVKLNKFVDIIKLHKKKEDVKANTECSVAGWGMTKSRSSAADVLMEVTVKTGDISCCKKWRKYFEVKQMMCTRTDEGKGFCQGDSGGPLVCNKKALGIVAYNNEENCADSRYPNVYMKIAFFMPWIEEVMNG